jgi:hypothetical protein
MYMHRCINININMPLIIYMVLGNVSLLHSITCIGTGYVAISAYTIMNPHLLLGLSTTQ